MTTKEMLELVSTQDLVDELAGRYESVVIAGSTPARADGMIAMTRINWKGDAHVCLGLATRVTHQINVFLENQPEAEHDDT